MTKRLTITLVALSLLLMLAVLPASAVTGKGIQTGATVFIGEQGLCLAAPVPVRNTIAWFKDSTATPFTVDIASNKLAFSVDQATFADKLGNWYDCGATDTYTTCQARGYFTVADPSISVGVWDWTQDKDVTGKSVPSGERLSIQIVTNGYQIATTGMRTDLTPRPVWEANSPATSYYGISPTVPGNDGTKTTQGFIDIRVKTDQGSLLNALYNSSTTNAGARAIPLTGMFVDTQPWKWGNSSTGNSPAYKLYWDTGALDGIGQKLYPAGTYSVYAEFNINQMKDYYTNAGAAYSGKTISETKTVTLVSDTVKITANKDTVTRSKPFSVTVTGKPATFYWVWVKGTSQMSGQADEQPPMIPLNQVGVYNDSPFSDARDLTANSLSLSTFGAYLPQNKQDPNFVAADTSPYPNNGTTYWAMIKTNENGVRTIEFATSNQTKAQKYTIRVENNTEPLTTAQGATKKPGDYKTDEVDIKVEKGTVTVTAAGDGSYYLGEEVKFSGTNTETVKTYLFIAGPNLQSVGSQIISTNPRADKVDGSTTKIDPTTFAQADVASDNTWSWKWGTATVALDAGTYTVYAVSAPRDSDNLANVAYGTVSIIIKKPFISATVSQSTVAKGDKLFVRGTAEGKPSPGVMMWVLGKNYPTTAADIKTASVNSDATFEFEIKDSTTKNMAAGQYFVVVQHPMQNDVFDIKLNTKTVAATTTVPQATLDYVRNLRLGGGTDLFKLLGAGSLQGSDAAEALVQAINSANVDDTYTKLQFLVEEPVIRIDPIGDKHVGDKFTIRGQTNLAVDDEILFEVYSSSFKPTQKTQSGEFSGATGVTKVTKGLTGMNAIAFDVDAATFKPDEYIVTATAVIQQTTGTALFNVLEGAAPTAAPTVVVVVVAPTAAPTAPPTAVATPTKTPTQPGFGALVALIGLGAVAFLVVRKH